MTLSCADTVLQSHLTESAEFYRSIIEREPQSRAEAESSSEVASEVRFWTEILGDFRRFVDEIWRF